MTINDLSTEQPKEPTPELENNSGQGPNTEVPDIVAKRFNWGAFTFSWIWGLGNKTYITLLTLVLVFIPFVGNIAAIIANIIFGIKGNRWAWQNKQWKSIEHFHKVQKTWACWGIGLMIAGLILFPVIAFLTYGIALEAGGPDISQYK